MVRETISSRSGGFMDKTDGKEFLAQIESEVIRMGGGVKKGIIEKRELVNDEEIRVSMRSTQCLGSIELFTLRRLKPDDYHLILLAIPRKKEGDVHM
jgi:hypothetical protein